MWTPLEILKGARTFTTFSDIYNYGTIIYEVLTGENPFDGYENDDVVESGISSPYSREEINQRFGIQVPVQIFHILSACWNQIPWKRGSFSIITQTLKSMLPSTENHINFTFSKIVLNPIPQNEITKFSDSNNFKQELKFEDHGFSCSVNGWKGTFFMKEIEILDTEDYKDRLFIFMKELQYLQHPNVVSILGYYQGLSCIILITEYFCDGSLDCIISRRGDDPFSTLELLSFASQILKGLHYLHQKKIPHRNLKVSNFCFKENFDSNIFFFL